MAVELIAWIFIVLLFLLAYLGLFIPIIPDMPLLVGGFLIYEWVIGSLGWFFWIVLISITIFLFLSDYLVGAISVKKFGGSNWSMLAAGVGMLLFSLIIGPLGLLVGPFVAVFSLEYLMHKDAKKALQVSTGTIIGFLSLIAVKFLFITGLIIWFLIAYLN